MGYSSEDAKKLVANTKATLQQEAEQATVEATETITQVGDVGQGTSNVQPDDVTQNTSNIPIQVFFFFQISFL
jgi:hypothetical protein